MKTLYAKGAVISGLGIIIVGIGMILLDIMLGEGNAGRGILAIGGIGIILVVFLLNGRVYKSFQIQYGERKIVIKRRSKELKNWKPHGKWQNKEDTILLSELTSYGMTYEQQKTNLEYYHGRNGGLGLDSEVFFQKKNGEMVSTELLYFTDKQIRELVQYIYKETGIVPLGKLKKELNRN